MDDLICARSSDKYQQFSNEVEQDALFIRELALHTPLIRLSWLSTATRVVWAKLECNQLTNSFKIRGAYNAIRKLSPNIPLFTASAGNHGLAVSYVAQHSIVELAQGKSIEWNPSVNRGVAIHRVTMPEAGFFLGLENEHEMRSRPRVESVQVLGEINKWYEPAASNQGVIGSIIVSHESAEQAMMLAVSLARTAKVRLSKSRHEDTVHIATPSSN
ncbi:hypothetical protein C1886_21695 [Pseudomonas sp. FW300-N1A1]|uniref:pyridoxal-phosphate dependent enzyme n=1 Tax=Pseudomonas sp. FW300-N1A1 TaxID=2075555 RepID=UPI000CD0252E|nr:pyridoxal-phosphate dependent enzyme [Pseudomonas sp. FW300-N1A1]POA17466.1 hypothetical protein C1886_21695 [Pseudomonas sp. FW300-N1A1]